MPKKEVVPLSQHTTLLQRANEKYRYVQMKNVKKQSDQINKFQKMFVPKSSQKNVM